MAQISLDVKKAYFDKVKRANYAESLRLEGYQATEDTGRRRKKVSKSSVLAKYRAAAG